MAADAPRRSGRARKKRLATPDAEETGAPAEKDASAGEPAQTGHKQSESAARSKGRKRKTTTTVENAEDSGAQVASGGSKASKSAKSAKPHSAKSTHRATEQVNPPAAAASHSNSGQPGASDSNQPAAADPACPKAHCTTVAGDTDVMLNQTNIGANNNKFYRMQLLQEGASDHWLWTRWGRVGDKGQTQLQGPFDADTGLKEFKKKFRCCDNFTCSNTVGNSVNLCSSAIVTFPYNFWDNVTLSDILSLSYR